MFRMIRQAVANRRSAKQKERLSSEARQVRQLCLSVLKEHPQARRREGHCGDRAVFEDEKLFIRRDDEGDTFVSLKVPAIGYEPMLRTVYAVVRNHVTQFNKGCWVEHLRGLASKADAFEGEREASAFAPIRDGALFGKRR